MIRGSGTPPRSSDGKPVGYIDPAAGKENAGKFFAYRTEGGAWKYAGLFACEATARRAAGLEARP
jgi:hypothetical protein